MPIWLVPVINWITHSLWRFISVAIIAAVLIGGPIAIYKHIYNGGYNKGWKEGYARSLKDNPPMVITGGTNTISNVAGKEPFFLLKVWKIKLSI